MIRKIDTDVFIVGAGLTGLALGYRLHRAGKSIVLAEKEVRAGGVIKTITSDGFTYEAGPNTGVLSNPELLEMFESLDGRCEVIRARPEAKRRLILKSGRWEELPSGPVSAVTTPLFTLRDKLRVLGEPFRARGKNPDESVSEMVKRRLGISFLHYAVDPFISGIYAGDPERLVTKYALPKLWNLEQQHGSFIRGALAKAGEKKSERERKATREVFSVKGGLEKMTEALASGLPPNSLMTGCRTVSVCQHGKGFLITLDNGGVETTEIRSDYVVTTTGAHALPELLPFIERTELLPLTDLVYARVIQIVAGYSRWTGDSLNAFGGLVPSKENKDVLGILFPSSIFNDRAPEGGALLSVFMGGMRNPDLAIKSDEELKTIALSMIERTLHTGKKYPDLLRVFRYMHAIPQYEITSGSRLERINELEKRYPGLMLAGNIRNGIGMADRVKQAAKVSDLIMLGKIK